MPFSLGIVSLNTEVTFILEFISNTDNRIVCMFALFSKSVHALHGITITSMPTGSDLIVHDMERKVPHSPC